MADATETVERSSDEQLLAPGALITSKFEVVRVLGSGGMGVVYEAIHLQTHGRVAIKLLRDKALAMPSATRRFAREARAAGSLRSTHVGRVLDADTTENGVPFLVMDYYEGCDLRAELRRRGGRIDVREACDIVLQACAGVAEAHARGFVHRDLKPGNLFLANESGVRRVRVLDFGISKNLESDDELTETMAALGTLAYMAPEQVRDAKRVDGRADVWALGVVLFRAVTGKLPFEGSPTHVAIAIATESPPSPRALRPDLPPALEDALLAALEKDAAKRPDVARFASSIASFADPAIARAALAEIASHGAPAIEPIDVPRDESEPTGSPVTQDSSVPFRPKRRRWWLASIAIVPIGIAAFVATRPSPPPSVEAKPPVAESPPSVSVSESASAPAPALPSAVPSASASAPKKTGPIKKKPKRVEDPDLLP